MSDLELIKEIEKQIRQPLQARQFDELANWGNDGYTLNEQQQVIGLNLTSCELTTIAFLNQFNQLQILNLIGNIISDLSALATLSNLNRLDLSGNQISDLSALATLNNLSQLDLSHNPISDLSALATLNNLSQLDLSGNQISDLSALATLSNLSQLDLSENTISDLSALATLRNLIGLDLSYNKIRELPAWILDLNLAIKWAYGENGLCLEGNPLTSPPPEIIQQGNDAIRNYFRELEAQGTDQLYEAKLLIVGEGGAGKTSLLRRLYQPTEPLPDEDETTKGIDIHQQRFALANGREFRLNVWDFGGQEIYYATHQFF